MIPLFNYFKTADWGKAKKDQKDLKSVFVGELNGNY
jgi:hypothetical protein